jgi:hypothetical protein
LVNVTPPAHSQPDADYTLQLHMRFFLMPI